MAIRRWRFDIDQVRTRIGTKALNIEMVARTSGGSWNNWDEEEKYARNKRLTPKEPSAQPSSLRTPLIGRAPEQAITHTSSSSQPTNSDPQGCRMPWGKLFGVPNM